jgi:hypothetical protein
MSSVLKNRISADMKLAMKARDKKSTKAIRMIIQAIKQKEIDARIELTDEDILTIIQKMVKQRKDSILQFTKANREDLVNNEEYELKIISGYLPNQLTLVEIEKIVDKTILDTNSSSIKDMGKLMQALKVKLTGKADMAQVSSLVRAKIS